MIVHLRPVVTHLRRLWCRYTRKACIDLKAPASNDLPYTKTCNMSGKSLYNPVGAFDRSVPRAVLRCILLCTVRYRYKTFHAPPALPIGGPLVDEVDAEEMQYHAPEHKVRECPVINSHESAHIQFTISMAPKSQWASMNFVCLTSHPKSPETPSHSPGSSASAN